MATRTRKHSCFQLIIATSLGVVIAAQDPQPPDPRQQNPKPSGQAEAVITIGRTALDVHTESTSRELFSACDRDSDDRLDLFEACDALETLGDPEDSRSFLALDRNRNGFLQWAEFDEHFRRSIERTGSFRVRTARRFVKQSPELQQAKVATPLDIFLQLNDTNENGGLDPAEIQKIVEDLGLQPALENQLQQLDLDQSGLIEPFELAPWFEQLRSVVMLPGVSTLPALSNMPPPWGDIDSNGDSSIDVEELAAALRRLDPGLARWAKAVLKNLDGNNDGKLEGEELPDARPTGTYPLESKPTGTGALPRATRPSGLLGSLRGRRN